MAAMKEIKKAGLKIPKDIALAGFTDEFHSTVVEPTLTSIIHPTFEMGQESARLVIDHIESETPHSPRQVVMRTKLVVRESSMRK
jgi:DNA-binding LacI/PurR family transcriptional regulator